MPKQATVVQVQVYKDKAKAEAAVALLKTCGIKAATDVKAFGRKENIFSTEETSLWVGGQKDARQASDVLELAARFATQPDEILTLPPEEGTMVFLDMLIHDCRQYLMIATGELKSIKEEGELDLDDPTNDIEKITIRLKRLKDQCMRMTGRKPLDWQR